MSDRGEEAASECQVKSTVTGRSRDTTTVNVTPITERVAAVDGSWGVVLDALGPSPIKSHPLARASDHVISSD